MSSLEDPIDKDHAHEPTYRFGWKSPIVVQDVQPITTKMKIALEYLVRFIGSSWTLQLSLGSAQSEGSRVME